MFDLSVRQLIRDKSGFQKSFMGFQRHKTTCFELHLIQTTYKKKTNNSQMHVQVENHDVRCNEQKKAGCDIAYKEERKGNKAKHQQYTL